MPVYKKNIPAFLFCKKYKLTLQQKSLYMKKSVLILICAGILSSCSGPQPDIATDKFAAILYEIHRADAVLEISKHYDKDLKNDSLSYYNEIFKKYGITRKEFIEEIEWYSRHADKYKELYDVVMKTVAQEEKNAEEERQRQKLEKDTLNLWIDKPNFHLPLEGEKETVAFDIPATKAGVYTLSADAIFYSDDGTENPRMTIIANYEDGTNEQNRFTGIKKDSQKHKIEVKIKTNPDKKLKKLTGWVLDHTSNTEKKHIDLYGITLKYSKE